MVVNYPLENAVNAQREGGEREMELELDRDSRDIWRLQIDLEMR